MKNGLILLFLGTLVCFGTTILSPAWAEQDLFVAYPPNNHKTTAAKIFLIGTAPRQGDVLVNGKQIQRNAAGHFAPIFPLQVGNNVFTLKYQNQQLQIKVIRQSTEVVLPTGAAFVKDSLRPAVDIARLPGDRLCFSALAPRNATVSVQLGSISIPLQPRSQTVELPPNSAILTQQNQPVIKSVAGQYAGCATAIAPGSLGQPMFQLTLNGQTISQTAPGQVQILKPEQLQIAEVTAEAGVARTGPSTDHSRLTPLPKGTRATVTGRDGEWLRLDYGGWIKQQEVKLSSAATPPHSQIRSVTSRRVSGWTEIIFPLEVPVPVTLQQGDRTLTLTLHNTTAQTDTIKFNDDPVVARLDWQQIAPGQVQYIFNLKSSQQWGYKLRYEGTSLVLSLRQPPQNAQTSSPSQSLKGARVFLDPGHGSANDLGARGPTGYPEKDATLVIAKLLRTELEQRGATVLLSREGDEDILPQDRAAMIAKTDPTLALSLHYNALPDQGDALKTQGVSAFWYNTQAHSLALFLHNYLVRTLKRPSDGVFWNNLALTRPTITPSVMLELGFMINPDEFEWIIDPQAQRQLARAIADGIVLWMRTATRSSS
jgi:N-acetylmuramoyl-L-alanine amidase